MARYIDVDALKLDIDLSKGASVLDMALGVIKAVKEAPTADVVPKSEVAILTAQNMALENAKYELQHELNKYKGVENIIKDNMGKLISAAINGAKQEIAREIFEEIDTMIFGTILPNDCAIISIAKLAELKKKYTEGEE